MLSRIEPRAVLVQAERLPRELLEGSGLEWVEVRLYPPRWKSIRQARKDVRERASESGGTG